MLAGFLFLLLLTDGESSNSSCSYRDLYRYLNPTGKKENTMTRPVKNHTEPIEIILDVLIYAILDVNEKEQKFVSYIWIDMKWVDEYMSWNPADFCDIDDMILPTKKLWNPDLAIEEMTERDKATESPFLGVYSNGTVWLRNDMMVISTCTMNVYKFPFDSQSCTLSFKSNRYTDKEMHLVQLADSTHNTNWSHRKMRTQSEWLFINMDITNKTSDNFGLNQSMLVCTINMKRRSILYVVNFMLPILFFLGLDLASFLISDSGGEKLGFKVTVLLAVTVMQLILNEILPSSSDRIPLIATYIIGIFGLMMFSLMETILVMYLLERDSKESEPNGDQSLSEDCGDKQGKLSLDNCFRGVNKWIHSACVCDVSASKTPPEVRPLPQEGSSSQLMEESKDPEKLSDELREVVKLPSLLLNSKKEDVKPAGYWRRSWVYSRPIKLAARGPNANFDRKRKPGGLYD
ncbi:5-hydroxytryptamine receptor 3A-like [Pagrus major]|uniref:5-hydroxytryptamine receptor 3A-like n=1 Tax=Pagrus major TaxID=143350 RepID=UPI003CC894C2